MGEGMQRAVAATRATRRTPQQQADAFMAANDRHPVVAGAGLERGGGRYMTADRKWHYLGLAACRLLPEGYPRWQL